MPTEKSSSRFPLLLTLLLLAALGLILQQSLESMATTAVMDYFELVEAVTGETMHASGEPMRQSASISLGGVKTLFKILRVLLWMTVVLSVVRIAMSVIFGRALKKAGQFEVASILRTVISITIYIVAFFMIFQSQFPNVNLAALFTGSTILGIVVGLAVQDTLGNLFAGIAMQADQPFQIGDVVSLASGRTGKVESITWRSVKIRTFDHRLLVINNSILGKEAVEVASKNSFSARYVNFNTVYSASPARTIQLIREVVLRTENVTPKHRPRVRIRNFGESSIDWEIKYWLEDYSKYPDTDALVRQRVWYAFQREGINFAYPVRRIQTMGEASRAVSEEIADSVTERIGEISIFAPLSEEETAMLAGRANLKVYAPEEMILRRGQDGDSMFIVHRGSARVEIKENGRATVLRELFEGDFFGEMGLFTGEPRSADVITLEETEVLEITQSALKDLLESNPQLVERLSEVIAERRELLARYNAENRGDEGSGEKRNLVEAIRDFFGISRRP